MMSVHTDTPNLALRQARLEQRLSQQALAEHLGTTAVNISRWERGITMPGPYFRQLLCDFFQKPASALGLSAPSTPADRLTSVWTVPYQRNPYFVARAESLQQIHTYFQSERLPLALCGLGGVGKTQLAVEYAYRYAHDYTAVLWLEAETSEILLAGFAALAEVLELPAHQEQRHLIAAIKNWLSEHTGWLVVLDNVDDLSLVHQLLLPESQGAVLLTTRRQVTEPIAQALPVESLPDADGALLLLKRAKRIGLRATPDDASPEDLHAARAISTHVGGLPLALDQAGAYVLETGCSLAAYLDMYRTYRGELLQRRGQTPTDHPASVTTTWSLSFEKIKRTHPAAAEVLRLCAFLDPDAIPEELISDGGMHLGSVLKPIAANAFKMNEAIQELRRFSLVQRDPDAKTLRVHRLVQAVLQHTMESEEQRQWAERAVRATNSVFPETITQTTWPFCRRYLSQAQICSVWIARFAFNFEEAASLLVRTAHYLRDRALYAQAESLYRQALRIEEQIQVPDHLDIANVLHRLAEIYKLLGRYEEAEMIYRRALRIREDKLGPDHPEVANVLNNLANIRLQQKKFEEAESLYQRTLRIREQMLGPDHPEMATVLNNLANVYREQGKHEEAESFYMRALHIWERALGPEHARVTVALNNLADLYRIQERYEEAKTLYVRALGIREAALGPNHPDVATVLYNLAELASSQEMSTEAERLYERALRIWKQALGPEHPYIEMVQNNLKSIYQKQG